MNPSTIHSVLRKHLIPAECYTYGFANLSGLLHEKFEGYSYGISILRKLDDAVIDGIKEAPTGEYLQHYDTINGQLKVMVEDIVSDLRGAGIKALTINPTFTTNPEEFDRMLPTLRYDISHKMVATRAGLGWIGKTDLFISTKFGARLRLTSILIDQEFIPESKPIEKSRCGSCSVCVEKCPAQAATGQLWDINTDRDVFFDAFKCRDKCSEFGRTHLKIDRRICGICVAVCPIGR